MTINNEKVAKIPVPPVRKLKYAYSEETKGIRGMAKAFRKAADEADGIADIIENDEMTAEQKESLLDEAQAKFLLQMMKIQKMADVM